MAKKLLRAGVDAASSRWAFCRSITRRRPTGWMAVLVGIPTVALAAVGYYRDEWPDSPQPPFGSEVITWLPWWAWLLIGQTVLLFMLFEVVYREVTRLESLAFPKPMLAPTEKGLLDFQVDLKRSGTGFPREMNVLTKRIREVNRKILKRNTDWKKHYGNAEKQFQVASRFARDVTEFAERVDEHLPAVDEQGRLMTESMLGVLQHGQSPLAPASAEDLMQLRDSINGLLKSAKSGRTGVMEFRKAALNKRKESWSRDLNGALENRLIPSLDRVITTIKEVEETTAKTVRAIDNRRRALKRSTRGKNVPQRGKARRT